MKKSRKFATHMVNSNIAVDSLPTFQISLTIVVLFEKIYDGEPILTVLSNIGEDVFCIFFWRARVCWPFLCLCRPFCIF